MAPLKCFRHELFLREYLRNGGDGANAYRAIQKLMPSRPPLKTRQSAAVTACNIRKRPEVKRREQELVELMAKKSDITIEKVLTDLQRALSMAERLDKPNEIITATMSQAKVVGLLRERVETGQVGDFDQAENVSDILEKVGQDVGPEAALALAKAWGLDAKTVKEDSAEPEDSELAQAIPPSDAVN